MRLRPPDDKLTRMSRRRAVRRPRRVQVNFWKQGEPASYVGYTTNISMTGMFIATNAPLPSGSRIRIEVMDRERGFMVEGVVAHARRIRGELARVTQSGMGVRFLSVEELVRELLPAAYGKTEEIPQEVDPGSSSPLEPGIAEEWEEPAAEERIAEERAATPPVPEKPPVPVAPAGGSFSVTFSSPDEFMEVYRRDILQGGLFVSTPFPARLQETVTVELHPPLHSAEPLMVRARVVQRFEPAGDPAASPNLLAGMGLELIDLPVVVEKLLPIVQQMRG